MKIVVLDVDLVIKNFKSYLETVNILKGESDTFQKRMKDIKDEMETIANTSTTLILDENIKKIKVERFQDLQKEAYESEMIFREKMEELQSELLSKNYSELEVLTEEWSKIDDIQLVINRNSTFYYDKKLDKTDKFIEFLKQKDLYVLE
jgi:Skp family chaperone for outer membrane proteins